MDRYYYKQNGDRYRVYDNSQSVGAEHICIADCVAEWMAKIIVHEMNKGMPYRPDISYKDAHTVMAPCIYCGVDVKKEILADNGYPVDHDYQWCKGCESVHEERLKNG